MGLFSKKQEIQSYLGVDISQDGVKVVELQNIQGKPQLVTYGYSKSRADGLRGELIDNINVTSTLIAEVCKQAQCSSRQAIAALPTSKTFTYVLKVKEITKKDLKNPQKVKAILETEAKKILPNQAEGMNFDYTIIELDKYATLKDDELAKDVKFLITAARDELVSQYTKLFTQAGLTLLGLDIESFALVRSLVGNDKSLLIMVDFGQNATHLSIVQNGVPVFNRSIDIGGEMITKTLADTMGVPIDQAEQYKLDLGILMQQQGLTELPKPIAQAIAPIISEMKFLVKSYYEQVSNEKVIDKIILTGGSAQLFGVVSHIEKELDIKTFIGDPWARVIHPVELQKILKEIGPRYAVALGLAMTKIK